MSDGRKRVALSIGHSLKAWEAQLAERLVRCEHADLIGWFPSADGLDREAAVLPPDLERLAAAISGFGAASPDAALNGVRKLPAPVAEADIVIHLGGSQPPSAVDGSPVRHWFLRHADGLPAHEVPPGFRETELNRAFGRVQLVEAPGSMALRDSLFPVEDDHETAAAIIAEQMAEWPAQRLVAEAHGPMPPSTEAETMPVLPRLGRFHKLLRAWRRLFGSGAPPLLDASGPWNIGVLYQPIHVLLLEDGSRNVRWLPSPSKGKSRMEPFGYLDSDGELNAVYRKGDEDGHHGTIARVRPKTDNILKRSRNLLEDAEDAGYPCLVMLDGIPHAVISDAVRGEVRLRPMSDDNASLGPGQAILDEALHAATLFEHDGRWWLFGTKDPWPEALLHGYHGPSPTGPFMEHANSPMKCDARHARPAGTPFVHEGQLYRPTLDASNPLRLAVWINRIDALSPEVFHETPVRRIDGFPATAYGLGVRTISAIGDLTLVDGLRTPVLEASKANASRGRHKGSKPRKP